MKKKKKKNINDLIVYDGVTIIAELKHQDYVNQDVTELVAMTLAALDGVILEVVARERAEVGYDFAKLISSFIEERIKEGEKEIGEKEKEEKKYLQ